MVQVVYEYELYILYIKKVIQIFIECGVARVQKGKKNSRCKCNI